MSDQPLLSLDDLRVHFGLRGSFLQRMAGREVGSVKAVDGVTLSLRRGEVLGVVGESGSGKTTLGRAALRTVPVTSGTVRFDGADITDLRESALRPLRRRMQMVFQDPSASLNPAMTIAQAVGDPLRIHGMARDAAERRDKVAEALERVGLAPADRYLDKFPSDLSGGQKQRAVIARAVICGPDLLVADEPVSMLDMSVRARILELMLDLKRDLGLTYLYVTHDLATAKFFCDTIAIMYLGRVVEYGPAEQIYADPRHPYTQALLRAIPEPDPSRSVPRNLPRGEVPDAAEPPRGCSFHPRCPVAFELCGWEHRDLSDLVERHWVSHPDEPVTTDITAPLLDAIKAEDPREPLWSGVREIRPEGDGVVVEFREDYIDPPLYDVGPAKVACLLYRDNPVEPPV
ncbi:MAG TPA: ABC transporter ATP-binding protein [Mycobacteriales bacterium]|jgi:oligopeptide/dipeptide ABC transporter ATP-binding protein|nr:ABC transporter ATP-binding protein [Mycobacteriales bacterium]